MKRIALIVISLVMGILLLAGCDMLSPGGGSTGDNGNGVGTPAAQTPLEQVIEKCKGIGEAKTIAQEIGIAHGAVTQYESKKTYTKAGSGYQVKGSVKQLNKLGTEATEAYAETSIDQTVKAGTYSVTLELDELYFSSMKIDGGVLEAKVNDNSVETVFGLGEDLPAAVHGMTLKVMTDAAHVTGLDVTYESGASSVHITLAFTY